MRGQIPGNVLRTWYAKQLFCVKSQAQVPDFLWMRGATPCVSAQIVLRTGYRCAGCAARVSGGRGAAIRFSTAFRNEEDHETFRQIHLPPARGIACCGAAGYCCCRCGIQQRLFLLLRRGTGIDLYLYGGPQQHGQPAGQYPDLHAEYRCHAHHGVCGRTAVRQQRHYHQRGPNIWKTRACRCLAARMPTFSSSPPVSRSVW